MAFISRLHEKPAARLLGNALRFGVLAGVIALLITRLQDIGWNDVLANLPSSPLFYLIFALFYMVQPVGEMAAYRIFWGLRRVADLLVFIRKRVFDFAVLSYSGEAMLYMWARKKQGLTSENRLSDIKDNMVLSALVSNVLTVVMVVFFIATGQMQRFFNVAPDIEVYVAIAAGLAILISATVLRFRGSILKISPYQARQVFSIHAIRALLSFVLMAMMWASALPMVPLQTWLVLVTLQLVLTRIPFLPNQDLIFLGLVLSVAPLIEATEEAVAGTFLMIGALTQISHLICFVGTSVAGASLKPAATT